MRKSDRIELRINLVLLSLCACLLVALARAFFLQVVEQDRYARLANRQHEFLVEIRPMRGAICDRNGLVLAQSAESPSAFVDPKLLEDPKKTARRLAAAFGLNQSEFLKKLSPDKRFVWIKRGLSPEEVRTIEAMNIRGVGMISENARYYPAGDLASQLIGFTGIDAQGLEGLEYQFDSLLREEPHLMAVRRDARRRMILTDLSEAKPRTRGARLTLTIDRTIQYMTERALSRAVEHSKASHGIAIVQNPGTGEILAMAVKPSFNPNRFLGYESGRWKNRAMTDQFEPGSTLKVFLAATALDNGVVRPDEMIDCENGNYSVGGHMIHDMHPHGQLSIGEIIKVSSNIGAAKLGRRVGADSLCGSLIRFGFGSKTGIDLPCEAQGSRSRLTKRITEFDLCSMAFGQGISVTAIQLTAATSAIANRGILMRPYVVQGIEGPNGDILLGNEPRAVKQAVSAETARLVTELMCRVTEEEGTGHLAALPGYSVAGKTGTAQKFDTAAGQYSTDRYVSSFIGFVPASAPALSIVVILNEPEGVPYGGKIAAPVFREIAQSALLNLGIQPDRPEEDVLGKERPIRVAFASGGE
ncbi:peptidoglycan D,D-transpeptidase FtsI family protein [Thermodesulfobacteriota bacterium]